MTTASKDNPLGPRHADIEVWLRALESASREQLDAVRQARSAGDYERENRAHTEALALAQRHERLDAWHAARILAAETAARSVAASCAEAAVEMARATSLQASAAVEWTAVVAAQRSSARDLCEWIIEAATHAAEALVVRDLLPAEPFAVLWAPFQGWPNGANG